MSNVNEQEPKVTPSKAELINGLELLATNEQADFARAVAETASVQERLQHRRKAQELSYDPELRAFIIEKDQILTLLTEPPHVGMVAWKLQRQLEGFDDLDDYITVVNFSVLRRLGESLVDAYWREGERTNPYEEWYKYLGKILKTHAEFLPGMIDTGNILNLWLGWKYPPIPCPHVEIEPFLDHVYYVIANQNQHLYDLFMKFHAHMFRHPMKRMPVALLLLGPPGVGKGFTHNFIGQLTRPHFLPSNDLGVMLLGNFNNLMDNILYSYVDNTSWPKDKHLEQKLKSLISEPRIMINDKFVQIKNVRNSIHFVFASNERETQALPIEVQDRRFLVFDVSDKYRNKRADYFVPLHDLIWKAEVFSGLLHYFQNEVEISEADFEAIPNTFGRVQQQLLQHNSVIQWLHNLSVLAELPDATRDWHGVENAWPDEVIWISKEVLYSMYSDYWTRNYRRLHEAEPLERTFGKTYRDIVPILPYNSKYKQYGRQQLVGSINKYFYPVPPLDTFREMIAAYLNTSVDELYR